MRAVQSMMAARCTESLTLDELAGEAGMSRYHFVRAFSRAVGMTPHAWQLDMRIQRARSLLDQGMSLADAALQLGFADQSHFQRAFKQRVAATPGEYRRNFVQD
jgi:transcriptional regulator GlxA family with amidase domain